MSVITVRGQLGSGAPEIGKRIAQELGIDYVDREIIAKVAELLNRNRNEVYAKERPPTRLFERIADSLGHAPPVNVAPGGSDMAIMAAYLPVWKIPLDDIRYLKGLRAIILDLARNNGIVIRGRGSQFILKDCLYAVHVLFVAPLDLRVSRVMRDMNLNEARARKEIEDFDSSRQRFIKTYFKAELEDPLNYDLVINTGRFNYESAASVVLDTVNKTLTESFAERLA